jgi:hypothetical protein
MKDVQSDERDDERGKGAEHPDLVLKGEEEHPLLPRLFKEADPLAHVSGTDAVRSGLSTARVSERVHV